MKTWLKASFVLTLSILVIAELVVRIFFARNMSGRFEYGYHPSAGFVESPAGTIHLVRAGGRRFHPQAFTRERPAGVLRIMVVGDSVARGTSVRDSYPDMVGRLLSDHGTRAEGINLAVGGYGSARKRIVLEKALEFHPSLIVLHINKSNEFEDEREAQRAEEFKSWHPRNWLMKSLFLRRLYEIKTESIFWAWLPAEVRLQQEVNDADAKLSAALNDAKVREWDERVRTNTAACVALARQHGVPILLVTQASLQRNDHAPARLDDGGLDALAETMTGPGVFHVSMKDVLSPVAYESLYADTSHLLRPGHELMAQAIVREIERSAVKP